MITIPGNCSLSNKESSMPVMEKALTGKIIGAAIEVHRILGPGLLESIYEEALCHEMKLRRIDFERQKEICVIYKDKLIKVLRLDLLVGQKVIVEIKSVAQLDKINLAQVISYLKCSGLSVGLLINFNSLHLAKGIKRVSILARAN